jgi:two-component system LytT family response regulator
MNVLIIEDEELASRRLQKMIQEVRPGTEILTVLDSVQSSIQWLEENMSNPPDLAFLDVQLSDGMSFEIFETSQFPCRVIFTTAFDEYALHAFKVNAIDYLLKPIKKDELVTAISRYENEKFEQPAYEKLAEILSPDQFKKRFVIRIGRQIKLVQVEEISFFYTESKLTYLTTFQGKKYPMDLSLDQLAQLLDPEVFFRANRQYILNINAIQEMYTYSKSRVKVNTHPEAPFDIIVSTERSSRFKSWLAGV